ncbi:MAG: hypothetical protein HC934_04890 [Acaryochloridaceae cyanobacterium SU_2_1]|nr:hypothetical protein [Acaryochloridaceae cyanobacterium SU_2_1]
MKREIPQKIDKPASCVGSQVYCTEKNGKVGSIFLRRTRSATVLGCLMTLSAFGGLFPQIKAAKAFDSAPNQTLETGLQLSQPRS